jgi:hypothetical protein
MASGINNIDNVNTNPGLNTVTSTPGDSNVPITSGAGSRNQFPNPNNIGTDGGTLTDNNQPLEESTSLNSGIAPNTNNINADGGALTNNKQPLEESTSPNSITPSTPDASTNQVLDKESILSLENTDINTGQSLNKATSNLDPTSLNKEDILQLKHKLQELIKGDKECNSLYDDTIVTWKNIVDRTKNILEQFDVAVTDTTGDATTDTTINHILPRPQSTTRDITQTDSGINEVLLKELEIIKNTAIDQRDHTTITGTDDKDYIVGSPEDDLICARDGNDVIFSDAGVDAIFAQGGMDTVQGGIGNNQIFGGKEGDTLVGGIDDDLIVGRAGDDRLFGAEGNDVLEGDKGADYFDCGEGIDIVLDFEPANADIIKNDCETS